MKQLITNDKAVPVEGQPTTPCSDCPWARQALPGWLGEMSIDEWLLAVNGETRIDCHALKGPECAGAAIYRANTSKLCRDLTILRLEPDQERVFASPAEFKAHHE